METKTPARVSKGIKPAQRSRQQAAAQLLCHQSSHCQKSQRQAPVPEEETIRPLIRLTSTSTSNSNFDRLGRVGIRLRRELVGVIRFAELPEQSFRRKGECIMKENKNDWAKPERTCAPK